MSRLEEDKANSTSQIADAQAETEKREERLRAMATKVKIETICGSADFVSVWFVKLTGLVLISLKFYILQIL